MVVDDNKLIDVVSGNNGMRKQNPTNSNRFMSNNLSTPLLIYHQNIRGLRNKVELFTLCSENLPHIFCFTEHHLHKNEINSLNIPPYNLGASYCRTNFNYGGVSIFVHEIISFAPIDLNNFCHEQDIEICALKLHIASATLCILSVYRSPSGNFMLFLSSLDTILDRIFTNSLNVVICGDFNINYEYLGDSTNKLKLDSLLASYNLHSTVDFPTRITNSSCTAIDNIFINKNINTGFSIKSCPNGLSDHDAQILTLNDIKTHKFPAYNFTRRIINDSTLLDFQLNLSYESWDNVFNSTDVDTIFNNFLNTYLRTFYHSFPLQKSHNSHNFKPWLTSGIITSCQYKRDLYLLCRSTDDPTLNRYYKNYCRILSNVIKFAKKKTL